jgi:hypothetical protein
MCNAERVVCRQHDLVQSQKSDGTSREAVEVTKIDPQQQQVVQRTEVVFCQRPSCGKDSGTGIIAPPVHQ